MARTNKAQRAVAKQINTNNIGSLTVSSTSPVAAAGASPTKAEYDVAVTLINELKTKMNTLITALKT